MLALGDNDKKLRCFVRRYLDNRNDFILQRMSGDAGSRKYYRVLVSQRERYVIASYEGRKSSMLEFMGMSKLLDSYGFSSPKIYSYDLEHRFVLMEDFGHESLKSILVCSNEQKQHEIYKNLVDLIIDLKGKNPGNLLPELSNKLMLKELESFIDYYLPYRYNKSISWFEKRKLRKIWREIFEQQIDCGKAISLQDYHVENVMFLDERSGIKSLGLLDFQDAREACSIYDLVSILQDARLEVSREKADYWIEYYAKQCKMDISNILMNYHILGMQRNSRILGIFAKKFTKEKDERYLQYIPLVEKYLSYNLKQPAMAELKEWLGRL